jgi:hypothetical protein
LKEGGGSVRGRWCVWRDAQWPWCWWQRHKHRVVIWSVQRKLLRNSCHAHTRCKYSAKRLMIHEAQFNFVETKNHQS